MFGSEFSIAPNLKASHLSARGVLAGEHRVKHLTCRLRRLGRSHGLKVNEARRGTERHKKNQLAQV